MADRIPGLDLQARKANRYVKDMATNLDKAAQYASGFKKELLEAERASKDIATEIARMLKDAKGGKIFDDAEVGKLRDMTTELDKMSSKAKVFGGIMKNQVVKGFDNLAKGIMKAAAATVEWGLEALIGSIQKVYELQERWTRAIGDFNKKLGAASGNLKGARKDAMQWEGTIRGLTDQFGEGLKMFAEYQEGFTRILPDEKQRKAFSQLGLTIAQGFDLGGKSAGEFLKAMYQLGQSPRESKAAFGAIISSARAADVPVNLFAKEIADSRDYMVEFGKEGQKSFITAAAYGKKLGLALRDLEKFSKTFDRFDDSVETVAKLNTLFGTTTNALDLMLEDDPAKRLETIRQSLLGQGKTWDTLTRKERLAFGQLTNLSQEEAAGVLKAGANISDFYAKREKAELTEKQAQQLMQKQLRATATTMFAFGAAIDKITVAVGNAIKPFLQMMGLASKGGKDFKSFSQVMQSVTDTIVGFFNGLAKNKTWTATMEKLAGYTKTFFGFLKDQLTGPNLTKNIDRLVGAFETLWSWSKKILAVWAGFKALQFVSGVAQGAAAIKTLASRNSASLADAHEAGKLGGASGFAPGGGSKLGKIQKFLGGGKGAGAVGLVAGLAEAAFSDGSVGEKVGGALGTAIGGYVGGPVGMAIGNWLGKKGGEYIEKAVAFFTDSPAAKALAKAVEERKNAESDLNSQEIKLKSASAAFEVALLSNKDAAKNLEQNFGVLNEQLAEKIKLENNEDVLAKARVNLAKAQIESSDDLIKQTEKQHKEALDQYTSERQGVNEKDQDYEKRHAATLKRSFELGDAIKKEKDRRVDLAKTLEETMSQEVKTREKSLRVETALLNLKVLQASTQYQEAAARARTKVNGPIQEADILRELGPQGQALLGELGQLGMQGDTPLKATATPVTGQRPTTTATTGGSSPNMARDGRKGGTSKVVVVAGDVYLDGTKVGRHLARSALTDGV